MDKKWLFFALALPLFGQLQYTQITDTLLTPVYGQPFNGTVKISAPVQVSSGTTVAAYVATQQVTNGAVSLQLAVNQPGYQYILVFTQYQGGGQWQAACPITYSPVPVTLNAAGCVVQGLPQSAPTSGTVPGNLVVGGTASFGSGTGYGCIHLHDAAGDVDNPICGGFGASYESNWPATAPALSGSVLAFGTPSGGNMFWIGLGGIQGTLIPAQFPASFSGDAANNGTPGNPFAVTVQGIQGIPVAATAPTTGQVEIYTGSAYTPGGLSAIAGAVTLGQMPAASAPYSLLGNPTGTTGGALQQTANPALASLTLEGSTGGSCQLAASATGSILDICSTKIQVTSGGVFAAAPTGTVITGTSGTVTWWQPYIGALKMTVIQLEAYAQTGSAQTFAYPTAYAVSPVLVGSNGCGSYVPTTNTTTLTLPANAAMTPESCNVVAMGN